MKKIIMMTLLVLVCTGAKAQLEVFDKYEDTKGVTTVFVSKAMLNLAGGLAALGEKKIGKMAGKMDGIRVLNCERKSLIPEIKKAAQAVYKRDQYEEMMRVNDDGQRVIIYQRPLKGGKSEFALLSTDGEQLSIINITGTITLEDMKQFTKD